MAFRYVLKPGEYLHDIEESETLNNFTRRVCSMTVYSLFFDYATVISKDIRDSSVVCEQYEALNRYKDIRCLDQTRVIVPHSSGTHDYINANYVDGFREEKKFILTQSPMENTVESFWTMIYEENVVEIVAMANLFLTKAFLYVPLKRSTAAIFGPYSIKFCGSHLIRNSYEASILKVSFTFGSQIDLRLELHDDAFKNSQFQLRKGDGQERKILHICFYGWYDKGTPEKPTEMLYLVSDMNYNWKLFTEEAEKSGWLKKRHSPIVVHCSTGAGRSGTLAVLDICCRKMDYTEKLHGNILVDVRDTVLRVRTQRDKAVTKPEQYLLLHLLVIEYGLRQKYYEDVDFIDLSNYTRAE
uniref:protein-tyrosine-phosphatase n=1 Tax=Elaeophora elaphi TaxID=1147741 RepID=A0A0R3RX97_9BILA